MPCSAGARERPLAADVLLTGRVAVAPDRDRRETTHLARRRQRRPLFEEVIEDVDRVADVNAEVVVGVGGIEARDGFGFAAEEERQR